MAEALAEVEQTGECYWGSGLSRLCTKLLFMQTDVAGDEESLHTAIEGARRKPVRSWELRTWTDLAYLGKLKFKIDQTGQVLGETIPGVWKGLSHHI